MKTKLSILFQYKYPKLVILFPYLIYVVYYFNYLTQLRKWYVIKEWKNLLKNTSQNYTAIDIGSGEAQYIIPFCNQFKKSNFIALDYNIYNIQFCKKFKIPNLKTTHADIEQLSPKIEADFALCVGVLQYLKKDEQALTNIYKLLKPNGSLLVYVPINGKFLTNFYPFIFKKYAQYESENNRVRVYQEEEIISKLNLVGFKIISKTYTYGWAGKLSHEILNSCSTLIISANWLIKLFAIIVLILMFPIILFLMVIDFNTIKKTGNGILILAKK